MSVTIAYITARKEPRLDWFIQSLVSQLKIVSCEMSIIVVDFYKDTLSRTNDLWWLAEKNLTQDVFRPVLHVEPKPTVWQGKHRLTSVDYFAAANARNTALCLAPDGWIVYVDDASVLIPGWLEAVLRAMKRERTITLGAYRKVFELEVDNGLVKSFKEDPLGVDTRNQKARNNLIACDGGWLYGCSFIAPTEAFLEINGWDENCDGMGYEDVITGQLLQNAGWKFVYDPCMMTYESQELHQEPLPMIRQDKGVSPKDKSHAILHSARMRKWAPNYWGTGELRGFREQILKGEPFPVVNIPDCDWFDGQPLKEM